MSVPNILDTESLPTITCSNLDLFLESPLTGATDDVLFLKRVVDSENMKTEVKTNTNQESYCGNSPLFLENFDFPAVTMDINKDPNTWDTIAEYSLPFEELSNIPRSHFDLMEDVMINLDTLTEQFCAHSHSATVIPNLSGRNDNHQSPSVSQIGTLNPMRSTMQLELELVNKQHQIPDTPEVIDEILELEETKSFLNDLSQFDLPGYIEDPVESESPIPAPITTDSTVDEDTLKGLLNSPLSNSGSSSDTTSSSLLKPTSKSGINLKVSGGKVDKRNSKRISNDDEKRRRNNIASQKSRQNRKTKQQNLQSLSEQLDEQNAVLSKQIVDMEKVRDKIKQELMKYILVR